MSIDIHGGINVGVADSALNLSNVEHEELKSKELHGYYWSMKDLEMRTGKSGEGLKEKILYPSKFRRELDSANGGFVFYPHASQP